MNSHRLSSRRGIVWRSDLVRTELVFDAGSQPPEEWLKLVHSLGFVREVRSELPESMASLTEELDRIRTRIQGSIAPTTVQTPEPAPKVFSWVPTQYASPPWTIEELERESTREAGSSAMEGHLTFDRKPPMRYLASWSQLRTRLQPLLQRPVLTRHLDEKKLTKMVSLRIPISRLPRQIRKRTPERLHVIADTNKRCNMLVYDQKMVIDHLSRELPQQNREFFLAQDPNDPQSYSNPSETPEGKPVEDPASHLLILGDLGILERSRRDEKYVWMRWVYEQWQQGKQIFVLVPYSLDWFPEWLKSIVHPIAWQGNQIRPVEGDPAVEEVIKKMFVYAYPAIRIELQLLRALRLMIPNADDASLESIFWQHRYLADNALLGAKNDRPSKESAFRHLFEELPAESRKMILETIRSYRQDPKSIADWYLEFANLSEESRQLIDDYPDDFCQMVQRIEQYRERLEKGQLELGDRDRLTWYATRASEDALKTKEVTRSIRFLREKLLPERNRHRSTRMSEVIADGMARQMVLQATIDGLECNPGMDPWESASIVGVGSTSRIVEVHVPRAELPKEKEVSPERAFWKSGKKPDWVSAFGTDEYGAWCEFLVPRHDGNGAVTQRMRWIKPGKFMMGSPEDEAGRYDDESPQHRVTLTQGFWLADTPCTQELWMAVTKGKNPSHFSGYRNPVERVSWVDCQSWLKGLGEVHPLLQPSLPTEAQWEYACRAGSTKAYCFGDGEQELEKYAWYKANSNTETHPVGEKLANAWGLYDVHGNVWEWCSDYHKSAASDPTGPAQGTLRVLRGGSWSDPARNLRSACRVRLVPGIRDDGLGFRLLSSALGAEPNERAMLPEAEPGTERVSSVQIIVKPTEPVGDPPESAFWKSGKKPDWVSAFGKDEYGLWYEFQLPNRWPDLFRKIKDDDWIESHEFVTQRMRWIKPGTFTMGSDASTKDLWWLDETQQEVTLTRGFWMADTPCTQGLWMGAGARENRSRFQGFHNPVERVSWDDCQAWLKELGAVHALMQPGLPTEAQWEYACRAGSTGAYCFGDEEQELEKYAWYEKNSNDKTHPVGQKLPNAWGLYDMHGNVWEWCQDWHDTFTKASVTDPVGPALGTNRVLRGGGWDFPARDLRSACRGGDDPGYRDDGLGFRLLSSALVAEPSERAMLPEAEPGTERVRIGSADVEYGFLQSIDLDAIGETTPEDEFSEIEVNAYTSIRVVSDQEGYQFDRLEKPDWAVEFGSDAYGLYSVFEVEPQVTGTLVRQKMRWIPPGRFFMGTAEGNANAFNSENPQHEVILTQGYWMFDTPCTQGLWTALMVKNPSYFEDPDRPVEQISWEDAVGFAQKLSEWFAKRKSNSRSKKVLGWSELSFRLPTEAEWEYACRAGTKTDTYLEDLEILGDANAPLLDRLGWYGGNSGREYDLQKSYSLEQDWSKNRQYPDKVGGTRKVCGKEPNGWGLYDMLGNVWEWCEDWYGEYSAERVTDPVGPSKGAHRVLRGGSWSNPARRLRSACRGWNDPGNRLNVLGFRLLSSARQVER
jgi:formylglycine-generating enzyme required for sulfatase activity